MLRKGKLISILRITLWNNCIINNAKIKYSIDVNNQAFPIMVTNIKLNVTNYQNIDYLPNSITHLTLGDNFNQKIDYLPNSVSRLILGTNFNQKVNYLPNTIKVIIFNNYRHKIDYLPFGIIDLVLNGSYNERIDYLPNSLVSLYLHVFNLNIDYLPNSIANIFLGNPFYINQNRQRHHIILYDKKIDYLPYSLKSLNITSHFFGHKVDYLPNTLLTFYNSSMLYLHKIDYLPINIQNVTLPHNWKRYLNYFPKSIKTISVIYSPTNLSQRMSDVLFIQITYTYNQKLAQYPLSILYNIAFDINDNIEYDSLIYDNTDDFTNDVWCQIVNYPDKNINNKQFGWKFNPNLDYMPNQIIKLIRNNNQVIEIDRMNPKIVRIKRKFN